jgi:hypothetical protein
LNRGLPEYEVTPEGEINPTLLRCVGWPEQAVQTLQNDLQTIIEEEQAAG